jgi:ubiquitin-activating enzyme E1
VVLTEATRDEQLRVSEVTHPKNIGLLIADTRGVFAQVFCDMGTGFVIRGQGCDWRKPDQHYGG